MAASVTLRGKEKLYKHFKNVNNPFWKLYNASDAKSPIQTNLSVTNIGNSLAVLTDIVDCLENSNTYILDTFSVENSKEQTRFIKPSSSITFTVSEKEDTVNGVETSEDKKGYQYKDPISLASHIDIIEKNARLSVEVSMYKANYEQAIAEVARLKNELQIAEDALADYEEQEEEEEIGKVAGNESLAGALTALVKSHGGILIENMTGKKVEGKIPEENLEMPPDNQSETDNKTVNGIEQNTINTIDQVVAELRTHDPNLFNHLYKLLLIARQRPSTFNMFMLKLEEF